MHPLHAFIILTLTTLITLTCPSAEPNSENWTIYLADGKSESITTTKTPFSYENDGYFNALRKVAAWNVVEKSSGAGTELEKAPYRPENVTITKIGRWGPYHVTDITNKEIHHKSIVLTDDDKNNWLLYLQFAWSTADVNDLPTITTVNKQQVLSYITSIPGTGHFHIEHYFIYDPVNKCPHVIDLSAINKAITYTVPADWRVWKGGGLDLNNLRYSHYIWRPDDANCCPTGGKIDLTLTIEQYALKVTNINYQPEARSE